MFVYRVTKTANNVKTIEAIKPTVCFTIVFIRYTPSYHIYGSEDEDQTTSKKCQYKLTINNLGALYLLKPRVAT